MFYKRLFDIFNFGTYQLKVTALNLKTLKQNLRLMAGTKMGFSGISHLKISNILSNVFNRISAFFLAYINCMIAV